MKKEEIVGLLKEEIKSLTQSDISDLTETSKIKEIGLNSIDFVKLLVFVEEKFNIFFEDEDLLMSDDILFGDMVKKIEKYLIEQN